MARRKYFLRAICLAAIGAMQRPVVVLEQKLLRFAIGTAPLANVGEAFTDVFRELLFPIDKAHDHSAGHFAIFEAPALAHHHGRVLVRLVAGTDFVYMDVIALIPADDDKT